MRDSAPTLLWCTLPPPPPKSTLTSPAPKMLLPLQSAKQLMSLCLSPSTQEVWKINATAKKNCSHENKWSYQSVQKSNQKGEGSKRESAFVSQEIQSIEAKQVLFLIMPTCHRSAVWGKWLYFPRNRKDKKQNSDTYSLQEENAESRTKLSSNYNILVKIQFTFLLHLYRTDIKSDINL